MTLTATVAARTPSLAVPTGSVRYEYCRASGSACSGSWTLIGSYALSGGTYKLSWTAPTAASYLLRARYAPTAVSQFTASDSTNVALTTTLR